MSFQNFPPKVQKNLVLLRGVRRWSEGQSLTPREVFGVLPVGGYAKTAQHHIVIGVVLWILKRHVAEDTTVFP